MRMTDPSPANRMPRASAIGEPFGDAGEERLGRAARAAHMLCDALWETLHEQLDVRFEGNRATDADDAPTERVAELAERLADVAATVALLAGAHRRAAAAPAQALAPTAPPTAPAASTAEGARSPAQLIDELDEPAAQPGQRSSSAASPLSHWTQTSPRARPWDAPAAVRSQAPETRSELPLDEHRPEEPAAWTDMIAGASERFECDPRPFAVLLVEILDVERLRLGARPGQLQGRAREIERAFTAALHVIGGRPAASLTPERLDRYWLLVPDTDRVGALELTDRLVSSFESVEAAGGADPTARYFAALSAPLRASQNGSPLKLAVGAAICPENGRDAAELMAHAEAELAARRAAERHTISAAEPA